MNNTSVKKVTYSKPVVLAATKQNRNFSASCMSGNAQCLHCRKY